jgi:hypothetical protein
MNLTIHIFSTNRDFYHKHTFYYSTILLPKHIFRNPSFCPIHRKESESVTTHARLIFPNLKCLICLMTLSLLNDSFNYHGVKCLMKGKFLQKNPTRCNSVSKLYYSIFKWSSTCFGRQTVHHQEPTTAQAASSFA